ncbi:unnamed protein product [Rotaria sordida]|uniref:Uncharacterized protein n=1 Tax=Rotaria sordida TaxID=392033 RepID=A0A820FH24_9BILA|nr:unnamed protein product [Rotaria sordida]
MTLKRNCKKNKKSDRASNGERLLWKLVVFNHHVQEDLYTLKNTFPEDYQQMEQQLESAPTKNIPGKLIQTKLNTRIWEYKLSKDNRVLFFLNFKQQQVIVEYAGQHLNKRRTDQLIRKISKKLQTVMVNSQSLPV